MSANSLFFALIDSEMRYVIGPITYSIPVFTKYHLKRIEDND